MMASLSGTMYICRTTSTLHCIAAAAIKRSPVCQEVTDWTDTIAFNIGICHHSEQREMYANHTG